MKPATHKWQAFLFSVFRPIASPPAAARPSRVRSHPPTASSSGRLGPTAPVSALHGRQRMCLCKNHRVNCLLFAGHRRTTHHVTDPEQCSRRAPFFRTMNPGNHSSRICCCKAAKLSAPQLQTTVSQRHRALPPRYTLSYK